MLGFWSYMEDLCLGGCAGWRKLGTYWRLMFRGKHCLPFSPGRIACFMLSCEHPTVFCTSVNSCSHLRTWHSAKVAQLLAAKPMDLDMEQDKSCTVMALLDGATLKRHRSWLKAEPPAMVVATIGSSCQMLERQVFKLDTVQILVIDEVDFMFNSSKQVSSLRKLLTSYSSSNNRQTVFASASIPQHKRFLHDCIQQKWTKGDVVHIHVNPIQPMPSCLDHTFVTCHRSRRHQTLLHLLQWDSPESGIIFVGEQSEKSKKAGNVPPPTLLLEFLKSS